MKFSVVIPTCDRLESLGACLGRLAPERQRLPETDYEVIVTDDGRRLSAEVMVRERYPWAAWTRGPCRGPAANRNHGASLARGRWLAFTDDDDEPHQDWLVAFSEAIEGMREPAILEGRTSTVSERIGPFQEAPVNETGGYLWSCNFAIRAEEFRRLGGFDEGFPAAHLEDVDFLRRARQAACEIVFVPAAVVMHPPRPLGPILRQVLGYRSYFYFARKHGVSLRDAGFSWHASVRWRWTKWRSSRSAMEAIRWAARCAAEASLLIPLCAWWRIRHAVSIRKT